MELDDAYANAAYIPEADAFPEKWSAASKLWARQLEAKGLYRPALSYGSAERERFDLFHPGNTPKGLVVFVHGGYWLRFDRSFWLHLTKGPLSRGWAVALPSYTLCPDVRISEITRQVATAVSTAAGMVAGPVALTGHSAGGHLVARMLAPGTLPPDVAERLYRVVPISPVADLRPLLRTSMNSELRLDRAEAEAESPVLMTERHDVPVTVWVGGDERPAFLDQARWLSAAWNCPLRIAERKHHFDVIEALEDGESRMLADLLG